MAKECSVWHIQDAYYKNTRFKEFDQYSLNKINPNNYKNLKIKILKIIK